MGFGVARQCSRNRCLARWTVWIPHCGRGGGAARANSNKTWSRARFEVFVPYRNRAPRSSAPAQGRAASLKAPTTVATWGWFRWEPEPRRRHPSEGRRRA
jgi:hypothetical protein